MVLENDFYEHKSKRQKAQLNKDKTYNENLTKHTLMSIVYSRGGEDNEE
jgi:hypothetical protein